MAIRAESCEVLQLLRHIATQPIEVGNKALVRAAAKDNSRIFRMLVDVSYVVNDAGCDAIKSEAKRMRSDRVLAVIDE